MGPIEAGSLWLFGSAVAGAAYVLAKRYYIGDVVFVGCFAPGLGSYCAAVFESSTTAWFGGAFSALLLPHVMALEAWLLAGQVRDVQWHNKVKCGTLASAMGSDGTNLVY